MARSKNASVGVTRTCPFNWLEEYDRRAQEFTKANDWFEYPLFTFARFPQLQPASRGTFFSEWIAAWKKLIGQDPKAKIVLNNLTDDQKTQLAALVSDTVSDLEIFRNRRKSKEWFGKLVAGEKSWPSKLQFKYLDACQAVKHLSEYAAKRNSISSEYQRRAAAALEVLCPSHPPDKRTLKEASVYKELAAITNDPKNEEMVHLYSFFRSECNLSGHEAEVRTALIRNAFWTQLDISKVNCRESYQAGESWGCDAVKQAVRRFKPYQGTTR